MDLSVVKEKVGPLPVWGWGVVVGALILAGAYFVNRNKHLSSSAGIITTDTYGSAADGLGAVTPQGVINSAIPDGVETNQSWIAKGVTYLSGQGFSSADAATWLQQYTSGIPVVGDQAKTAISKVLDQFGTPPDMSAGVPSFVSGATDVATPATATVTGYIRRSDGEISETYSDGTRSPLSYAQWLPLANSGASWVPVSNAQYQGVPIKVGNA